MPSDCKIRYSDQDLRCFKQAGDAVVSSNDGGTVYTRPIRSRDGSQIIADFRFWVPRGTKEGHALEYIRRIPHKDHSFLEQVFADMVAKSNRAVEERRTRIPREQYRYGTQSPAVGGSYTSTQESKKSREHFNRDFEDRYPKPDNAVVKTCKRMAMALGRYARKLGTFQSRL